MFIKENSPVDQNLDDIECRDYDLLVLITAISDLRDVLNSPNVVRAI